MGSPVVLAESGGARVTDRDVASGDEGVLEVAEDNSPLADESAEREQMQAHLLPSAPLAGMLPFDVEAARQSIDAFFRHLSHIVRDWPGGATVLRFAPWVVAATALAVEYVRQRRKRAPIVLAPDYDGVLETSPLGPGDGK
jgi:hypothetical protein